jgi:hypothetical protein
MRAEYFSFTANMFEDEERKFFDAMRIKSKMRHENCAAFIHVKEKVYVRK